MRHAKVWIGVAGLIAVSFFAFDPAGRFQVAWSKLSTAAPYLLVALATLNLLRSAVRSTAALIGPAVLVLVAVALKFRSSVDFGNIGDLLLLIGLILAVALVVSALPQGLTRARVLWTGEARPPLRIEGRVYAIAILGELRLNLSRAALAGRPTLIVLTLGGRVVVDIPREWSVVARPPQPTLLRIQERGRRDPAATGGPDIEVRMIGAGGSLELQRF